MAQQRQPGWWYPFIFLGVFVVVVSVNLTMAYFATSTFTGLATDNAYEKGLAYNQHLAMARAQAALGWTVETTAQPVAGAPHQAEIDILYRDRDGKPVDGLAVHAALSRPTVTGFANEAELQGAGSGRYVALVTLPLGGEWDAELLATGPDVAYQTQKRFILP